MAAALQVLSVRKPSRGLRKIRYGVTLSGNYAAGGQALDLTAATNPGNRPGAYFGRVPASAEVENVPDGYTMKMVPGVALNDWKVKIFTAVDTELAAAAYPAPLIADANFVITVEGEF